MDGNKTYKMNEMKKGLTQILIFGLILASCEEEPIGQQPLDSVPPGEVTNVESYSTPGGAVIKYTPPKDEDLLYVKAVYSRKEGVISESKSSKYADSIEVEGFGDVSSQDIELVAVDRSRNSSKPVKISIVPLQPAVQTIAESINVKEDFGGIRLTWENPSKAEVSIVLQEKDSLLDEYVPLETYYSSAKEGMFAVYELDTLPRHVEVYVQDRWENRSEIAKHTVIPLFDTEYDKNKFSFVDLPGDGPHHAAWVPSNIWNGTPSPNGYSSVGGQGIWPQSLTIDLGVLGKLSRMKIYQRVESENYIFAEGNLKKFEVWGAETLDLSGSWDSWTKLAEFESTKPSGLPFGQVSDEDRALAVNGENFSFDASNPKVRYIRFLIKETWAGGDNFQIMEMDVFGDNRQ